MRLIPTPKNTTCKVKTLVNNNSHVVLNAPGETTIKPTGVMAFEMTVPIMNF